MLNQILRKNTAILKKFSSFQFVLKFATYLASLLVRTLSKTSGQKYYNEINY